LEHAEFLQMSIVSLLETQKILPVSSFEEIMEARFVAAPSFFCDGRTFELHKRGLSEKRDAIV
jgi:hypothetical protein